jgi:predicted NUDIX family phosphoesterase
VKIKETDKMTGEWKPRAALRASRDAMESWSQIVYDEFIA